MFCEKSFCNRNFKLHKLDQSFLSGCLRISRKLYIHGSCYISASEFHATDLRIAVSKYTREIEKFASHN